MPHTHTPCPDGLSPCLLSRAAGSPRTVLNSGKPAAIGHRPAAVSACASHVSTATDKAQTQGHPDPTCSPASALVLNLIFKEPALFPAVGKARAACFLGPPTPRSRRAWWHWGASALSCSRGREAATAGGGGIHGVGLGLGSGPHGGFPGGPRRQADDGRAGEVEARPTALVTGGQTDPETRKRGKRPTRNRGSRRLCGLFWG